MRWARTAAVALPGLVLAGFGFHHPHGLTPATAHDWWTMHVALIPVFPLLAAAPLWLVRAETGPLAWAARILGYGYATFYTALDVLAGIAGGLVVEHDGRRGADMHRLFDLGNQLGSVGVWMLMGMVVAVALLLGSRAKLWVVPGAVVMLVGCWLFEAHHIFYPEGVLAMVLLAVGTSLLSFVASRTPNA